MKILLTGKNGQVGWELQRTLAPLGEVVAVDRRTLDLGNPDSIRSVIREVKPDLIVNPAAYTAVDKAESEPELAMAVNGVAPGVMAEEAKRLGAAMIHYSTDYVFDGTKTSPYTEEDIPNPINVYGKTKLAGEQAIQAAGIPHLILRTSWVYGARGKNFLLTILRLAKERDELKIVDDQIGAPTWSRMIAEATAQILAQSVLPLTPHASLLTQYSGVYNLAAAGQTSWCGFAKAILESMAPQGAYPSLIIHHPLPKLIPISTAEYPLPAPRPLFSLLARDKLSRTFGMKLPNWDDSLVLCMAETGQVSVVSTT
ncbi:MAG: dTDP-4-dehydrorhamnose reductase [Sulfuricella sp.]